VILTTSCTSPRYGSLVSSKDIEREERAVYAIAIVVLAPVVIVAVMRRVHFDGGTSLCLLFVVLAVIGLITTTARSRPPQLPRARIHGQVDTPPRGAARCRARRRFAPRDHARVEHHISTRLRSWADQRSAFPTGCRISYD
jgi:hypothetical protein